METSDRVLEANHRVMGAKDRVTEAIDRVIEFEGVTFAYESEPVLEDINLTIERGDFLGVVGPNGGGKTTFLRLILGELQPSSGSIRVNGMSPRRSRKSMGYVPQYSELKRDFPLSSLDVVLMGRLKKGSLFLRYDKEDLRAALSAMEKTRVDDLKHRRFSDLSGGQRQRVLIARALASKPEILILDEPTASVDSRVEQDIYELLKELNREITIILVSHDLGFISSYVKRVACVNRRLVCHPTEEISKEIIMDIYNSSINMIGHRCEL